MYRTCFVSIPKFTIVPRLAVRCAFTMLGNSELIRLMFEQPVRQQWYIYWHNGKRLYIYLDRYISEPRERAAHYTPATKMYQSVASMPMLNFKHNFN